TVATTSVREDMAVALVQAFGTYYEQILLVADPLFMNRLVEYAAELGMDWRPHRLNVIIGEEVFGEHFRDCISQRLGLDPDRPEGGYLMSSFGVGELGMHLCYETPATIVLRRAAANDRAFARDLLGIEVDEPTPIVFAFNPMRTFMEVTETDATGYGQMTISMLDTALRLPLLRYQPGDLARLLHRAEVIDTARRHRVGMPDTLPAALVAVKGRKRETLPNGSHVAAYKDALYADHEAAGRLTGACRVVFSKDECTLHVQLARGKEDDGSIERGIVAALPAALRPAKILLWPYGQFPFGMSLDYERKFTYYLPG
ncbi:MAG: hypothetical protein LC791_07325, partial [Acidobacteria bacterium]|nr:hypothetical protein [Acidobacteriota bacterium]